MALIKCLEPECTKMVSDKAVYCPECGFPVAAELKRIWEESPDGVAERKEEERRQRRESEKQEAREKAEREEREALETARKLETFMEIREKLIDYDE